jgi:cytochrome c553
MRPEFTFSVLVAGMISAGTVSAQAPSPPDPQRGSTLVTGGNQNGAAPCSTCHGPIGGGNPDGPFPRLAGQPAAYLLKQLQNYADGTRPNDIMTPIAQALSEQERQDASAYYSSLNSPSPPAAQLSPDLEKRGRELATVGIASVGNGALGIQACGNCHGPFGTGEPPLYPALAGQWAGYASAQLEAFKGSTRKNDIASVMREIAGKLPPEDIEALSRYYESIRSPNQATR